MNYFNNIKDYNVQYILNFLQTNPAKNSTLLFNSEKEREIKFSSEITILHSYSQETLFIKQCLKNKIPAVEINNKNFLQKLKNIKTPYCLLAFGQDSVIVNDLTNSFIDTFKSLKIPFCFCGSLLPISRLPIETTVTLTIPGNSKYLNSNLVFGYTKEIIRFYEFVNKACGMDVFLGENQSQRILLYFSLVKYFANILPEIIDSQQKLFSTISLDTYDLFELDKDTRIVSKHVQIPFSDFLF